jgi:hypothetical protein
MRVNESAAIGTIYKGTLETREIAKQGTSEEADRYV